VKNYEWTLPRSHEYLEIHSFPLARAFPTCMCLLIISPELLCGTYDSHFLQLAFSCDLLRRGANFAREKLMGKNESSNLARMVPFNENSQQI
jgi:hypothetical protein